MEILWILVAGLGAFLVAWIDGANNAANSIGAPIGSGALSLRRALVFASIFEFVGGVIYGRFVSVTLLKGIVDVNAVRPVDLIVGMSVALVVTGVLVTLITRMRIPMSISQSIVGGIIGFGLAAGGVNAVLWPEVSFIVAAWVLVPFLGIVAGFAEYKLFSQVRRFVTGKRALLSGIVLFYLTVFMAIFLYLLESASLENLVYSVTLGLLGAALLTGVYYRYVSRRMPEDEIEARDFVYKTLLISSSATMAFSHGAHDVSNPSGPLTGVLLTVFTGQVPSGKVDIPYPVTVFSALGIATGILTWGYSVVETIGERITPLSVESAFVAQFSASQLVLVVTRLGIPTSTTGAIVGAIAGVGLARGVSFVNMRLVAKIIGFWFLGVALTALATFGLVYTIISI
ncbi:inorganic phosphate transporter [Thermogladius sp. KZ2Tp1]|uniref:inorganic phosphate transporter n=1 Tax=Thermogladius sp. KZ2Tp1 TaxID=3136289 RepID=UPI003DA97F16